MKIGRHNIDVSKDDLILDNGSCYQIVTRAAWENWNSYTPKISKTQFAKLKKGGMVFTNDELKQAAMKSYSDNSVTYWKFDIDKIKKGELSEG